MKRVDEGVSEVRSSQRLLVILCVSVGVAMVGLGIIWPLVPVYASQLGARGLELGLIIASFNIARTIAGPFSGRFSDRWGRKSFIAAGLLLYAVVSVFYVRADDVASLVAVRLVHGMAAVMVAPVAMALVADAAADCRLGRAMGTLSMSMMIGLGAGPMLGGVIQEHFGLAAAFYSMGGLALLTLAGVILMVPSGRGVTCRTTARQPVRAGVKQLVGHRWLQVLVLLRVFTAAGQGCVYTFLPLLAAELNVSGTQIGLVLGTNIFLLAALQRVCGNLADRSRPEGLLLGGTLLSGLAVLGMPLSDGFAGLLAANVVMGTGTGAAFAGGFVLAGRLGRFLGQGAVMGITDAGWSLGMIAAPILAGLIMDRFGMPAIFYSGGGLVVAGTGLTAMLLTFDRRSVNGGGP